MPRVQQGTLVRDEDEIDWTNGRPERPKKMLVRINLDPELVRTIDHFAIDADLFRYEAWEMLLKEGLLAVRMREAQALLTQDQ